MYLTTLTLSVVVALPVKCYPDCGPLCDYVHREDPNYDYTVLDVFPGDGVTTYLLNFTSQQWYDDTVSSRSVWWHHLAVNIPDKIDYPENAMIYLSWYSNTDNPPNAGSRHVIETAGFAKNTGMVTAVLRQIPNQPVWMRGDLQARTEDDIIAWTWKHFADDPEEEPDPEILLRFPMCKAAKRTLDAVTEFAAENNDEININSFMIAGESKRGWTTWLMGAVDERVKAIVPSVLSCLNLNTNMHHYYQSMGNWPFAFLSYYVMNITSYLDHPRIFKLEEYVDPYRYRHLLTMPKLMVSGASDEFFMPDDYDYFFDDLVGDKYIWLMENTGHSISSSPLVEEYWHVMESFYLSEIKGRKRPEFSWQKELTENGASITLFTEDSISDIVCLAANTPEIVAPRRDFRDSILGGEGEGIISSGVFWEEFPVKEMSHGVYRVYFDNPEQGYLAFFIKVTFPFPDGQRKFIFTTQAEIIPRGFPFEDCNGTACRGSLV